MLPRSTSASPPPGRASADTCAEPAHARQQGRPLWRHHAHARAHARAHPAAQQPLPCCANPAVAHARTHARARHTAHTAHRLKQRCPAAPPRLLPKLLQHQRLAAQVLPARRRVRRHPRAAPPVCAGAARMGRAGLLLQARAAGADSATPTACKQAPQPELRAGCGHAHSRARACPRALAHVGVAARAPLVCIHVNACKVNVWAAALCHPVDAVRHVVWVGRQQRWRTRRSSGRFKVQHARQQRGTGGLRHGRAATNGRAARNRAAQAGGTGAAHPACIAEAAAAAMQTAPRWLVCGRSRSRLACWRRKSPRSRPSPGGCCPAT